jgi:hypothetical protein
MKLSLLLAHAQAFRKKDEIKLAALDRFSKMPERRKLDLTTRCRIALSFSRFLRSSGC